jgi:DNA-binding transcriptional LysR family regulator
MYDMGFLMEADTQHHGVQAEILGPEPLVLIASPDHAMARLRTIGTDDLRQVQLLSPEAGCAYRELFEAELRSSAGGPVSFIEFGTIEAIKRGVATGLGVSLLPTVTVADAIAAGTLVALPWEAPFEVYTQLAWRKGKRLTREMRLFIDRAIQFLGEDRTPALAS